LLILVPVAYIVAVIVASAVIVIGVLGPYDGDIAASFVLAMFWMTISMCGASVGPTAIIVILAEVFSIRSVFVYLALGGLLGLILQQFLGFHGSADLLERRYVLFPAAGFVGGFAYWLIAGRFAGR
jgi:hypothetical protein